MLTFVLLVGKNTQDRKRQKSKKFYPKVGQSHIIKNMEIPKSKALMVMGYERIEMRDFLMQLEKNLGNVLATCEMLRINRNTFYYWYAKDPWFKDITDKIRKEGKVRMDDLAEHGLIHHLVNKSVPMIIFYLKTRHPDYKEKKIENIENINLINYSVYVQNVLNEIHAQDKEPFKWQKKISEKGG